MNATSRGAHEGWDDGVIALGQDAERKSGRTGHDTVMNNNLERDHHRPPPAAVEPVSSIYSASFNAEAPSDLDASHPLFTGREASEALTQWIPEADELQTHQHPSLESRETPEIFTSFAPGGIATPPLSQSRAHLASSTDSFSDSSSDVSTPRQSPVSGFVDLTSESPPMSPTRVRSRALSRPSTQSSSQASASPRAAKRRKVDHEEIDLCDVESDTELARVLEKQRVNTVKAQQEAADKIVKLANLACVVCMEDMTKITATHCGHLFCHTCLMEALIAGESQASEPGKGPSKCPICRKRVKRPKDIKDMSQVIPLEIKVKNVAA